MYTLTSLPEFVGLHVLPGWEGSERNGDGALTWCFMSPAASGHHLSLLVELQEKTSSRAHGCTALTQLAGGGQQLLLPVKVHTTGAPELGTPRLWRLKCNLYSICGLELVGIMLIYIQLLFCVQFVYFCKGKCAYTLQCEELVVSFLGFFFLHAVKQPPSCFQCGILLVQIQRLKEQIHLIGSC